MKKKILSILLAVCMVLTMVPTVAWADALPTGTFGDFTVTYSGTAPTFNDNTKTLTFATADESYTIGIVSGKTSTSNLIVVSAENVTLNLNGVTISAPDSSGGSALTVTGSNMTLKVSANSSLTGGSGKDDMMTPGDGISGNVAVTGAATLTATGGIAGESTMGSSSHSGYGINGDVSVSGTATVNATGGIGESRAAFGGSGGHGIKGDVSVSGTATVNATGGFNSTDGYKGGDGIIGDLTVTDSATVSVTGGGASELDSGPGSALTGTLTAVGFIIKGGYTGPTDKITHDSGELNHYRYITAKPVPTAATYAVAFPAAQTDTDYELDTDSKTLVIKTAKGAAFWSASGKAYLDYTVKLANDIDVSAFLWTPVGSDWNNSLTGTFDGQGHTITGMKVNVSTTSKPAYAGLFGCVKGATIKNIGLIGSSVTATSTSSAYVGSIAGFADASSTITNCYNTGSVSAASSFSNSVNSACAGGIVGKIMNAATNITNCYSTGSVSAAGTDQAKAYAGGIAGFVVAGTFANCYNTGSVSATAGAYPGGIVGAIGGTVSNCYYLAGSGMPDKGINDPYDNEPTVTGCGTFGGTGTLTAGTTNNFPSAQTLTYTGTLLSALNGWVNANANSDYRTWKADSVNVNGGYPVLGSPLVPKTLTGITALTAITNLANGTDKTAAALGLPDTVELTTDNGTVSANVNWNVAGCSYDKSKTTEQTFTVSGTVTLPAGVVNTNNVALTTTISVTVKGKSSGSNNGGSKSTSSTSSEDNTGKTETKVDPTGNTATVTTKPDSVNTNGNTTSIETTIPSVTVDNTPTSTNGSVVDTAKKAAVTINMPTEAIMQQLAAKKDVDLTVTVPHDVARDAVGGAAITINAYKEILETAKENLTDVTIKIKDADTQQLAYSWTFKGEDLAKSAAPMTDVNIAMSVHLTTEVPKVNAITPSNKGLVLSFDHSGLLPSVASVKFSALDKGFKPGQTLYFYYYNPTTKQIESLGKDAYTVDADGNVTVQIYHCSDYVLLPKAARSITLDTRTYTMRPKKNYQIGVKLTGISNTTIKAYSSTKGVANVTVLKNGNVKVTGAKSGLTYIMIDVYDSKNKFLTHASIKLTVQNGVKEYGNSARQYGIF